MSLRVFLFNVLGPKNVDRLRYWKFSHKLRGVLKEIEEDRKYLIKQRGEFYDNEIIAEEFSQFYEPEMLIIPKILKSPRVIVDCGANYGPWSCFLSKMYQNSKIFSFEPVTRTFNILKKVKEKFNLKNVELIKKGLGSQEEKREICLPDNYTILAYVMNGKEIKGEFDTTEEVEITTLDKFIKEKDISRIDFIKCDVEGFELEIFKGGTNVLEKLRPIIFVEIEERHTKKYNINPQEVMEFILKKNYVSYALHGDGLKPTKEVNKDIPLYLFIPNGD